MSAYMRIINHFFQKLNVRKKVFIMSRPTLKIITLHGHSLEELITIKNTTDCKYTRLALAVITMKYQGFSNAQIIDVTGLSKSTICSYARKWNAEGMPSVLEHRGGKKPPKLEPQEIAELIETVTSKTPTDFGFVAHTWTCALLVLYVEQSFGVKVTGVTIWNILKANNLSYKRARPMPTKSEEAEQEAFKKNRAPSRYFRVF